MASVFELTPDQVFAGQFRVIRPLARGGMGAVYVVEQLSTGKQRALKLMLPIADLGERRFEQEARTSSLIGSEHVVEVIDVGVESATQTPWLAMELLEGESLSEYLDRRGPLDPAEALEILRQLCHALVAAHDLGVVHRDLKPDNVFLARARTGLSSYLVKVLDFGLAKVVEQHGSSNTMAMGSPLWMAPEQSQAEQPISCATDVWALGLIAYRMLSGHCFWRSLELNPFYRELLIDPLPTASERCQELEGPSLPPGFDDWFARCVARSPDERFGHARAAWNALTEVLGGPGESSHQSIPSMGAAAAPPPPAAHPALGTESPALGLQTMRAPEGAEDSAGSVANVSSAAASTSPAPSTSVGVAASVARPGTSGLQGARKGAALGAMAVAGILLVLIAGAGIWYGVSRSGVSNGSGEADDPELAASALVPAAHPPNEPANGPVNGPVHAPADESTSPAAPALTSKPNSDGELAEELSEAPSAADAAEQKETASSSPSTQARTSAQQPSGAGDRGAKKEAPSTQSSTNPRPPQAPPSAPDSSGLPDLL